METQRTDKQQKAYDRWLASNNESQDKEWARFYNALQEKYKHLPLKQRSKAIRDAIERKRGEHYKPISARMVSGGTPSLGKRK